MNSRERVLAAINHRTTDRVPITFDAEKEVKEILRGHFGVRTDDEIWRALNVDTRLVGANHRRSNIVTRPDGVEICFWGYGLKQVKYELGERYDICEHPLAGMTSIKEIEDYDWPMVDELSFDSIRESRRANPDAAIIAYITHGGYFNATFMRGMEQYFYDIGEEPELAARIVKKITDYIFPAVEKLCAEAGDSFDIFYMADDFCSSNGPMVSPDFFRAVIKPYLQRIAAIVHAHGKYFLLHVCGSVRQFLPDLIEAGVDLLEPIQTTAAGMEPVGLKRDFGDKITFYGSIDTIHVLPNGTPADVRNEVLKNYRALGNGGGFILGPAHTYIQPDSPLANILTMYKTAFEECNAGLLNA